MSCITVISPTGTVKPGIYYPIDDGEDAKPGDRLVTLEILDFDAVVLTEGNPDKLAIVDTAGVRVESYGMRLL